MFCRLLIFKGKAVEHSSNLMLGFTRFGENLWPLGFCGFLYVVDLLEVILGKIASDDIDRREKV